MKKDSHIQITCNTGRLCCKILSKLYNSIDGIKVHIPGYIHHGSIVRKFCKW